MVKKYENPILVGSANSNKPSGRKPILSIWRSVVYYSSVAAGWYGDVCILLVEHTRKVSFSDHVEELLQGKSTCFFGLLENKIFHSNYPSMIYFPPIHPVRRDWLWTQTNTWMKSKQKQMTKNIYLPESPPLILQKPNL